MFRMIGSRMVIAVIALIAGHQTSWNGTTAQASVSATHRRSVEDHPQEQVDADERERVEQPLDELPRAASVADPQVAARERDEHVGVAAPGRGDHGLSDRPGEDRSAKRPTVVKRGCSRPIRCGSVRSVKASGAPV